MRAINLDFDLPEDFARPMTARELAAFILNLENDSFQFRDLRGALKNTINSGVELALIQMIPGFWPAYHAQKRKHCPLAEGFAALVLYELRKAQS